jgi:hypothetical protein
LLYLLDADTLIRSDREAYPMGRFPVLWDWLLFQGGERRVKIPVEQYEEIVAGRGDLVDWLRVERHRELLVLEDDVDMATVQQVLREGYAPDLDEVEIDRIGGDPFLVAHGMAVPGGRTVVSFEVSAPSKQRAKRKVPDVCAQFGVPCVNVFEMIKSLDFSMDWRPGP